MKRPSIWPLEDLASQALLPRDELLQTHAEPVNDSTPPARHLRRARWIARDQEYVTADNFVTNVRADDGPTQTAPASRPDGPRRHRKEPPRLDQDFLPPELDIFEFGAPEPERLLEFVSQPPLPPYHPIRGEAAPDSPRAVEREPSGDTASKPDRQATPSSSKPEYRHLQAEAPQSVLPGRRFPITVQVMCGNGMGADRTQDMAPLQIPVAGREVSIDIIVHGGARVVSDYTARVTVMPQKNSAPVRFELEAMVPGPSSIVLRAFAVPSDYLGEIQLDLTISPEGTGEPQRQISQATLLTPQPSNQHGLMLEVDVESDGATSALSFRLRGPSIGIQSRQKTPLKRSLDEITLGIERQLDQLARRKPNAWSDRAVEAILRGIGAELWQDLLPPSIQQLLLDHLDHIDSLMVVGADDPVPWELMLPPGGGQASPFLGDRVLITRWAYGAGAEPLELGTGAPRVYVLPANAPPQASQEVQRIQDSLGKGRHIATLDELLDLLDAPDFGLLHFAAHNMVASGLPASAWIKLDQPFQQNMLGPQYAGAFAASKPLVFMNACNSSAASPLWTGSTSWAGRFLKAGAGAFIGSLWELRDEPAREFADHFYGLLKQGQTLGEAFRQARQQVSRNGDPTRLGYSLYGNPRARLI